MKTITTRIGGNSKKQLNVLYAKFVCKCQLDNASFSTVKS